MSDEACIVPFTDRLERQWGSPAWGTPPPWPRAWASMLVQSDPLQQMESGLGATMRYVDVSNLNSRENEMTLAGLGGGTLVGNVLGTGLGQSSSPPAVVCSFFQYECQNWKYYTAAQQAELTAAAKQLQAQWVSGIVGSANEILSVALDHSQLATANALAAVQASEAAYLAAEKCDKDGMLANISASDSYYGVAIGEAEAAGEAASDLYALAGKYTGIPQTVNMAEQAGAAANAAGDAVDQSEAARQQIISDAKKKLASCSVLVEPIPEPEETEEKKGTKRMGLLWLGLLGVVAMGAYAVSKKKG